jgi:hypothetical protein
MASIVSYLNGISAFIAVSMAFTFGAMFIIKYIRTKKRLMPYAAVLGITLGFFHMGTVVSFISLIITGSNIDFILGGYLGMTCVPIAILNAMYLGFTLFKPELVKKVLIIFGITVVVYFIAIFGFPDLMFGGTIPPEIILGETELADFSIRNVALYLVIFYILCVIVILGGGFYKLQKRIEGEEAKKAHWMFIAYMLFAIGAILDVTVPMAIVVVARAIMITSYYYLYKGFMGGLSRHE